MTAPAARFLSPPPARSPDHAADPETALRQGGKSGQSHDLRNILAFLGELDFIRTFSPQSRDLLASLLEVRRYQADEIIVLEGGAAVGLYFIYLGSAEVLKHDADHAKQFKITVLERCAMFGEMSFMDNEPASATIRAVTHCEVLLITKEVIERARDRDGGNLLHELAAAVAVTVIKRLRRLSSDHVLALQAELHQNRLRNEFLRFFSMTMALFGIASLVQKLINQDLTPTRQMLYSWGFLLLTLAPIGYFARRQGLPLASFGLTTRGTRKALTESLAIGAMLALLAIAVRRQTLMPEEGMLSWGSLRAYSNTQTAVFFIAYVPHCFLQEFIGRGVIQGSLQRFVTEQRPIAPIFLTSALFGIFHLYVSIGFAVLTFTISLLFGWMYWRHRTLTGVTLAHFALGFASIALGFN